MRRLRKLYKLPDKKLIWPYFTYAYSSIGRFWVDMTLKIVPESYESIYRYRFLANELL